MKLSPGVVWALGALVCASLDSLVTRQIAASYPMYQLLMMRSVFALVVVIAVTLALTRGRHRLRMTRPGLHILRGLCFFISVVAMIRGLLVLPFQNAALIYHISPILIAFLALALLGERVPLRRWGALAAGAVGVWLFLDPSRPWHAGSQALWPLAAGAAYAGQSILARRIGATDSAAALAVSMLATSAAALALLGAALYAGLITDTGLSMAFMPAWTIPSARDLAFFAVIAALLAGGSHAISQAYRLSEASLIAPLEWLVFPLTALWGVIVFAEPLRVHLGLCILLILGAAAAAVWRETAARSGRP